jgi:hypothetical protein
MIEAGWRVKRIARVPESEFLHQVSGCEVIRVVACEDRSRLELFERMIDNSSRSFFSQSDSPKFRTKMTTQFGDSGLVWT